MMTNERIIVGMGVTGLSCARYFRSLGESFSIVDSRVNPPGLEAFRVEFPGTTPITGEFTLDQFLGAAELIVSPGVSLHTPAIKAAIEAGVEITGDVDLFSRAAKAPIIAVTGSNGKSTVVSLLGEMARIAGLKVAVGGNLDGPSARPALDLLADTDCDLYVLELSSFQLETTSMLCARAVALLNITEDHMDRYDSFASYSAAKHRIFYGCGIAVVNRDDVSSLVPQGEAAPFVSIGLGQAADGQWGIVSYLGTDYLCHGASKVMPCASIKMPGIHNVSNALTALALGDAVGIPIESMKAALSRFPGLNHRCQWVSNVAGVDYYNDSKGTNVGASVTAIQSIGELIDGRVVLIAGGLDKESDFSIMRPVLEHFVSLAVLIGRDALKLAQAFKGVTETVFADTMQDAVKVAAAHCKPGDAVLLSPACASFDMFRGYAHRGEVFCAAVEELK
jgi:UDP-N-acetylmuramoylalanine--D-glutamate ligase